MVVVKIGDGLGNQMYNYVCGYSVAKHDGDTLLLDTTEVDNSTFRTYGLDEFNIDYTKRESFSNKSFFHKVYKRLRRDLKYNVILERSGESNPLDMNVYKKKFIRNKYLKGYFQNIYYFNTCKNDILRQFTPKKPFPQKAQQIIKELEAGDSCSLHIRGGDIPPLPIGYYANVLEDLGQKNGKPRIVVFSNVHELAEEYVKKLGIEAEFIWELGEFSDIEEMFVMRACRRHILSDSTFSRWSALLDERGGDVYAPFSPDAGKIYLPGWKVVELKGNEDLR